MIAFILLFVFFIFGAAVFDKNAARFSSKKHFDSEFDDGQSKRRKKKK